MQAESLGSVQAPTSARRPDAKIRPEIKALNKQLIGWRRHLHSNPELSFKEFNTSKFIAAYLKSLPGVSVIEGVASTGIVGVLRGDSTARTKATHGQCIGMRADMDALPIIVRLFCCCCYCCVVLLFGVADCVLRCGAGSGQRNEQRVQEQDQRVCVCLFVLLLFD